MGSTSGPVPTVPFTPTPTRSTGSNGRSPRFPRSCDTPIRAAATGSGPISTAAVIRTFSFFAPYTAGPFRKIGEHVQRSHDIAMHQAVMVLDAQPGILAPPLDYECVWTDKGSGAMFNGSVWRPIPPPGYVALGHVVGGDKGDGYTGPERPLAALVDIYSGGEHANTIQLLHSAISKAGWNKPGLDRIWCVRRDLVTEGDVEFIYEDRGSGAHSDLSCWRVKARAGEENQVIVPNTFVGVPGYHRPDFPVYVLCRRPDIVAA
ncbi:Vps62-related protein [Nannocystis pusilla]|uniref:Vps62-related protein n=1 Tax=Nannocystis pusilla TaxID=889268 RepID=UPI003DA36A2B